MAIIKTSKNLKRRRINDFYATPIPLVTNGLKQIFGELYPNLNFDSGNKPQTFLDTGCGLGNFGKGIKDFLPNIEIDGIDINDLAKISKIVGYNNLPPEDETSFEDYVEYPILEDYHNLYRNYWIENYLVKTDFSEYDCVIGNPPFKLAEEFIYKSMQHLKQDGYLIYLLRTAFLESKSRYEKLYQDYPLQWHFSLVERISFFGNGKTDDTAYSFFVFQKGAKGESWLGKHLSWK